MARTIDKLLQYKRKKQILYAAAKCFVENGFHQTGMQQIYKKSGFSAGLVYHYFRNKEAIIEGIVDEFYPENQNFNNTIDKYSDFTKGFLKASKVRLKISKRYIKYGSLIIEIYSESFRNKNVEKRIKDYDKLMIDSLEKQIVKAINKGQINSLHEANILAHTLVSMVEGVEDRMLFHPQIKLNKLFKPFEYACTKLLEPID